ncbi:MAG: glycosyltransferase family A protein [Pseudomonadota bacterium]
MTPDGSVSVVIPSYNRRQLVGGAIDSVLAQTRSAAEIIVVDDGSSDGTSEWLALTYGDAVRCIVQDNGGVAAARNTGIDAARSDYVAFLDSDDRWPQEKLALQMPLMAEPGIQLSATNWQWEDEDSDGFSNSGHVQSRRYVTLTDPLLRLCHPRGHGILIQTCIIRRDVLVRLGGFDHRLRIAEDMDLIFRVADEGAFKLISDILMTRGKDEHTGNLTDIKSVNWQIENFENTIGILKNTLTRGIKRSAGARKAAKARLVQLISYRAMLAARQGDLAGTRAVCRQALPHLGLTRPSLICLVGIMVPQVLARK